MKSRYLLFFLILIYIISPCTATGDYKFRTMSPSGGFYYDGIKAIEQDKEGFIWTMMDYELYRFDGYHYKKYYPYFASMAPTKRWIFNNMASDLLGYLYVNTNNGVYRYDRNSDQFDLKSATKLFSVLLASKRPLITELADKLRLKYPLLPTISPCPTMRLEAIRSIIPISCRRYPKSV